MKKLLIFFLIVNAFSISAQDNIKGSKSLFCPNTDDVIFSQGSEVGGYDNALYSNTFMKQVVAQHLSVPNIISIRIFGVFLNAVNSNTTFDIKFYEDNNGVIGEEITELATTSTLLAYDTGDLYYGFFPIYYWDWTPENVLTGLPDDYFVSFSNSSTDEHFAWFSPENGISDNLAYAYSLVTETWSRVTDGEGNVNAGFSLCVRGYFPNELSPGAITDFQIISESNAELTYDLSWVNPTVTYSGESLNEITEVVVEVNGEPLAGLDISTEIGAINSITGLAVPSDGFYYFKAYAINGQGDGDFVFEKKYMGMDAPGKIENLKSVLNDNHLKLTWDAPTVGRNNEYFDPASISQYVVVRSGNDNPLYEIVETLEFVDSNLIEGSYTYSIYAENYVGESENTKIIIPVGTLLMTNGDVTGCGYRFYDEGGPNNYYQTYNDLEVTLFPQDQGDFVQVTFDSFDTDKLHDFLNIYDGTDTDAELLSSVSGFDYNDIGFDGTVTASNSAGALTFQFSSSYDPGQGWSADVNCLDVNEFGLVDVSVYKITETQKNNLGDTVYILAKIKNNTFYPTENGFQVMFKTSEGDSTIIISNDVILPQHTIDIPFSWIPSAPGNFTVEVSVDLEDDENLSNNTLLSGNIEVGNFIHIGEEHTPVQNPLCFVYKNSVAENIYLAEEINESGNIVSATYKFRPFGTLPDSMPIKIWMGETSQTEINNPVNADNLVLVYDGYQNFPKKDSIVVFEFSHPYLYSGSNSLMVLFQHPMADDIYFDNYFICDEDLTRNRSFMAIDNTTEFDPYNLPVIERGEAIKASSKSSVKSSSKHAYLSNFIPNVIFEINKSDSAYNVYFSIADSDGPLEGATLNIGGKTLISNAEGKISTQVIAGEYNYIVVRDGYYDVEGEINVDILEMPEETVMMEKIPVFSITGKVYSNVNNTVVSGAEVIIGSKETLTNSNGEFVLTDYVAGSYNVSVLFEDHKRYTAIIDVVDMDINLDSINLLENIINPIDIKISVDTDFKKATLSWGYPLVYNEFYDDFESYEDFTLDFSPWITYDIDSSSTYGFEDQSFLHMNEPMSGIIYNAETNYVFGMDPTSGEKLLAIFNSETSPTNDWIISPLISIANGSYLSFNAKAYDPYYFAETFQVLVSTEGKQIEDFKPLSNKITTADAEWNTYSWDMSEYADENVYVAIHCISNDQFILLIDDFSVKTNTSKNTKAAISQNLYLNDMETPVATDIYGLEFEFENIENGQFTAGVQAVYETGVSEIIKVDFEVNGVNVSNNANSQTHIYPNPANDLIWVSHKYFDAILNVYDISGKVIYSNKLEKITDKVNIESLQRGVYIFEVVSENGKELFKINKE